MTITADPTAESTAQFAKDVCDGLCQSGQKTLPSKYLYDPLGSTLFEAISLLPEYGLTRAEERLLRRHSREIVGHLPGPVLVSELGSGNGRKTRWILSALCEREPLSYYPIEISRSALAACESELRDIESVSIVGVERDYLDGLREVAALRPDGRHLLVLFLGSTIGNFDAGADARFLSELRSLLRRGDSLLLGADLIKPLDQMLRAYDDPLGITAAFNLNLLARMNRELDADFDLRQFGHLATFNEANGSIEMHIRSKIQQIVHFRHEEFPMPGIAAFETGETIWTESCRKYSRAMIAELAVASGFRTESQWADEEWPFAESLLLAE